LGPLLIFASITLVGILGLAADGSTPWWTYLNYPGLEAWKFINLIIFIVVVKVFGGRYLTEAMRARGESIKQELARAKQERDAALLKLSEVETRFAGLDAEVSSIRAKAKVEAEAERQRLAQATEQEVARIRDQAKREIDSAAKAAKHDLRRFAAAESVRLAENILEREIKPEDDVRLARTNVEELGRVQA
jgi:F-type H+-transporting ATPase subunit b